MEALMINNAGPRFAKGVPGTRPRPGSPWLYGHAMPVDGHAKIPQESDRRAAGWRKSEESGKELRLQSLRPAGTIGFVGLRDRPR
jgi:hypothetical protein